MGPVNGGHDRVLASGVESCSCGHRGTDVSFFDWGCFKPHGQLILVVTAVLYLAALVFSALQWWRLGRASSRWWPPGLIGLLVVGIMGYEAVISVLCQLTSKHHQEVVHVPALVAIVAGTLVSLAAGLVASRRSRDRQTPPA